MRYFFVAGERSGDLHAGNLARAIKNYDNDAVILGFGGEHMSRAGVEVLVHYSEMAVMGFVEVLLSLPKIARYLKRCKSEIINFNPDVVVLVDYGGFNKRIASWAKGKGIRVFYYISPKVWAWNQNRAWSLKASVDRMFVILPFEKEFFKRFDWNVDYVGNPVLDAVKAHLADPSFRTRNNIPDDRKLIALLPGSRRQEVRSVVTAMAAVVSHFPNYIFAVAAVNTLDRVLYEPLEKLSNVILVFEDTYNLLQNSVGAVVTSGTATLETALFRVPQVVVYKASASTYWFVKMVIKVPFISLVNLIAQKEVVRELIQADLSGQNLVREITLLLNEKRNSILADYDEIWRILDTGSASDNAARLMVKYLKEA